MASVHLRQSSEVSILAFMKDLFEKKKIAKPLFLLFIGVVLVTIALGTGSAASESGAVSDSDAVALESLLSEVEGVGRCRVLISYEQIDAGYYSKGAEKRVYAVIVVCRGAKSAKVEARIREAVSSLYGIGYNRVTVLKMN